MTNFIIFEAIEYAKSLIGIPYRWYDENKEEFNENDKFWCVDKPAPTAEFIISEDKSIVCTGLINLMCRYVKVPIPKYKKYPGGTVAWYKWLSKNKCIKKLQNKSIDFSIGTLLIRKYKNEVDQGHVAIVIEKNLIIHAAADIPYEERFNHKNHGYVKISDYDINYFTHYCLPEKWLIK